VEFIDLKAQYAALSERIDQRIRAVLDHGGYIIGPEVKELEGALAAYCRAPHAVTCANGTDALVLALKALGVGQGDAVITSPFTFFATAEAAALVGARVLFADVDADTFNLDPAALERAIAAGKAEIGDQLKAVIAVDLFGLPADYRRIEPICREHGLALIADAAQSFGGELDGRRTGTFGDVTTTSFFPAKPLGCYGDGGALFTANAELADLLRSLRVHGKGSDKYDNVRIGTNSRLDTIQAAILIEKLAAFPDELVRRQDVARRYDEALRDVIATPTVPDGFLSSWAQYSVLATSGDERARLMAELGQAGVPTTIYYAKPLHLQTALAGLGYRAGDFPVAEDLSSRVFSLPMSPYLAAADQDRVIAAVRSAYRAAA
jgi:dTDP-4-amino-4,6-dideoxygalactose transaminase